MKRMLFNATHQEELRVAIVDGQKLIDLDIETSGREQRKGNIYKGVITRIEPSLEACFVNYGEERHGFLPFKEVARGYFKEGTDVRSARIQDALAEGQELIIQVEKEERGNKGAALTTFVSLAGRYLVLMPNNPRGGGVSRRIEGDERQELREAMDQLEIPGGMSMIARTAGIGRRVEELQWDLNYLLQLWSAIDGAARENKAPILIYLESSLVIRAIRDYFSPDIGEILIDTDEIHQQATSFMGVVMPDNLVRVKRYSDDIPLFSRFQIEHQIETAYARNVQLPSGGAVVIDHTEALVAVDVNSARSIRGADIEETALRTNLEAADEVARQLRLRDLGGLIVIDFIDMEDNKNQRAVEQRLRDALHFDRARVQMGKISRFGLMELSRQRLRPALNEGSHVTCPRCNGTGVIRDAESSALHVLRLLQEEAMKEGTAALHAQVPVDVATFLLNEKRHDISQMEARLKVNLVLIPNKTLETPHHHIERLRHDDPRLDDAKSSFQLVQEPEMATLWQPNKAQENKSQTEALVKSIQPAQPAPTPAQRAVSSVVKPAASGGFFKRLLGWLGGTSTATTEEAASAPATAESQRETQAGRKRSSGKRSSQARTSRRGDRRDASEQKTTQAPSTSKNAQEDSGSGKGPESRRRTSKRSQRTETTEPAKLEQQASDTPEQEATGNQATDGTDTTKRSRGRRGGSRRTSARPGANMQTDSTQTEDAVQDTSSNDNATSLVPEPASASTEIVAGPAIDLDEQADSSSDSERSSKRRRRGSRRSRRPSEDGAQNDNTSQEQTDQQLAEPGIQTHETPKFDPKALELETQAAVSQAEPVALATASQAVAQPSAAKEHSAPVEAAAPAVAQETVPLEQPEAQPQTVAEVTEVVEAAEVVEVAEAIEVAQHTAGDLERARSTGQDNGTKPIIVQDFAQDTGRILKDAGMQIIETRPGSSNDYVEPKPMLGRPRKPLQATQEGPLQQVETSSN